MGSWKYPHKLRICCYSSKKYTHPCVLRCQSMSRRSEKHWASDSGEKANPRGPGSDGHTPGTAWNLLPERTRQRGASCLLATTPSAARKGQTFPRSWVVPGPRQPLVARGHTGCPLAAKARSTQGNSAWSPKIPIPTADSRLPGTALLNRAATSGQGGASFYRTETTGSSEFQTPTGFSGNNVYFLLIKE